MKKIVKKIIVKIKNGKKVKLMPLVNVDIKSSFEGMNYIGEKSSFKGQMGYGSYVSKQSIILGNVGRFCSIGNNVKTIVSFHPSHTFVSTHPSFYSLKKQNGETFVREQKFIENRYADVNKKNYIIIGNDVWIGDNVLLLAGIKIGDGSIIAAGAVVTKDVEPYSIVGGVPAHVIRHRFTKEQIEMLSELRIWEKPIQWIKENAEYFDNIELFLSKMNALK